MVGTPRNAPPQQQQQPFLSMYKFWRWLEFAAVFFSSPLNLQPMVIGLTTFSLYKLYDNVFFWLFFSAYGTYIYLDKSPYTGAYGMQTWFSKLTMWRVAGAYYPIKIHKTAELPVDNGQTYIFGCHPHGVIGFGPSGSMGCDGCGFSDTFPGVNVNLAVLKFPLRVPFCRELFLASGCVDASRESITWCLQHGRSVAILLGGALEALWTSPKVGPMKIVAHRKGFVRIALQTNSSVVPVVTFGEMELFTEFSWSRHPAVQKFQRICKKFTTFSMPVFRGAAWYCPLMPICQELNVVFGAPVSLTASEKSSMSFDAQVDTMHERFLDELKKTYYDNRDAYGYSEREMEFVTEAGNDKPSTTAAKPGMGAAFPSTTHHNKKKQ